MPAQPLPRGLYAIADTQCLTSERLGVAARRALNGGACVLQYRDHGRDHGRRVHEAAMLRDICREHDVPFIVARDARLAEEVRADGVHLEDDRRDIAAVRHQLGDAAVIGVSCHGSVPAAVRAAAAGADYVSFGAFFPSPTEPGASVVSRDVLHEAAQRLTIPIVAVGGITPANGRQLIRAGAKLLAVVSGIFGGRDAEGAAHHYAVLFDDR